MLAEPRHEPKVRQGVTTEVIGVDGNAYAPFPLARRPARLRRPQRAASTACPTSRSTGRPSPSTSPRYDGARARQRRLHRRQLRRCGSRRSAGTRSRPTTRTLDRISARCCARRWRTGRSACRRASTTRRAPTPRPAELAALAGGGARLGGFYHTPRPLPAGRRLPGPVPRGDRDRAPGRIARPHHALLPPGDVPRPARADARRSSTTRGPRASTSPSTSTRTSGRARGC